MTNNHARLLDESIQLELNLAKLYTLFHDTNPEDEDFWWQLAMEERGHAALLQQEKKTPQTDITSTMNLLAKDLEALKEANKRIQELIATFTNTAPSRKMAMQTALDLELSAGESHYQHFIESPSSSATAAIFKQLNQEDRDHAERIKAYRDECRLG